MAPRLVRSSVKKEVEKVTRRDMLNALIKSPHGDLTEYIPVGLTASIDEPEFLARLIAWNHANGQVRDSKIALPMIALRNAHDQEYAENAIAALMYLDPRSLVKAYDFHKTLVKNGNVIKGGHRAMLQSCMQQYLHYKEANQEVWDKVVLQHRHSMKELYAVSHYKPKSYAQRILFDKDYPKNSVFAKVANLKDMSPKEAAGTILNYKIPFQIAMGALQRKKEDYQKHPEFALALMSMMTGQQLINSTNFLQSLGVFDNRELKSEYDAALKRAKSDKRVNTLKADKAISSLTSKRGAASATAALKDLSQEKVKQASIEGDWVILGDCSGSMDESVDLASEIAGLITSFIKNKVHLIFFNTEPRYFDVTGKSIDEIRSVTRSVRASGGTSCGVGLAYLRSRNIEVDGIVIVSDGQDINNTFGAEFERYCHHFDKELNIYFFRVSGGDDSMSSDCERRGIDFTKFEIGRGTDYYAVPNLIKTLKVQKFGLIDEIMQTPLLRLSEVFNGVKTRGGKK